MAADDSSKTTATTATAAVGTAAAAPRERTAREVYFALAKILLLYVVLHSCTTGLRFTATLDALGHGASAFEVGCMLACVSLFPAFCSIAAGRWLDRAGPRRPFMLAVACAMAAGGGKLLLPTSLAGLWPLFAACLLVGLGFLLINTVVQRLAGDVSTKATRAMAFTILSIVTSASGLATPVATGYVIEHLGYAAFYAWCLGAPFAVGLVSFLPAFSRVLAGGARPAGAKTAASAASGAHRSALDFLKMPALGTVLAASVIISVAWEVGNLLIPVYCTAEGLSPADVGWVLGSFSAATFAVRLVMPMLMKHMKEWRMIEGAFLVAAFAFAIFPFFSSKPALMACAFLLGLGLGASFPNMMSLVYRLAPKGRVGEAIGVRLMLINASKAGFPAAMGAVGSVIGAGAALWGLALLAGSGFAMAAKRAHVVFETLAALHED